jgi:hypothetical protein
VVVPAAYDLFDDWQEFLTRRRRKKEGAAGKKEAPAVEGIPHR